MTELEKLEWRYVSAQLPTPGVEYYVDSPGISHTITATAVLDRIHVPGHVLNVAMYWRMLDEKTRSISNDDRYIESRRQQERDVLSDLESKDVREARQALAKIRAFINSDHCAKVRDKVRGGYIGADSTQDLLDAMKSYYAVMEVELKAAKDEACSWRATCNRFNSTLYDYAKQRGHYGLCAGLDNCTDAENLRKFLGNLNRALDTLDNGKSCKDNALKKQILGVIVEVAAHASSTGNLGADMTEAVTRVRKRMYLNRD